MDIYNLVSLLGIFVLMAGAWAVSKHRWRVNVRCIAWGAGIQLMLGQRLVATEIPAYQQLALAMENGAFAHPRSPVVIAYALCGFAHVASLAIFVGGTAALVPERRKDLADVGPRALLAATLACLMTGAVAGTFFVR